MARHLGKNGPSKNTLLYASKMSFHKLWGKMLFLWCILCECMCPLLFLRETSIKDTFDQIRYCLLSEKPSRQEHSSFYCFERIRFPTYYVCFVLLSSLLRKKNNTHKCTNTHRDVGMNDQDHINLTSETLKTSAASEWYLKSFLLLVKLGGYSRINVAWVKTWYASPGLQPRVPQIQNFQNPPCLSLDDLALEIQWEQIWSWLKAY